MSGPSQEGLVTGQAPMTAGELTWSPAGVVAVKKNALASAGGDARVIAIAPQ
jgi:hypothetical protein